MAELTTNTSAPREKPPGVCQDKVEQVMGLIGLSDADARAALLEFDGEVCDQLLDWLTCPDAKQKAEVYGADHRATTQAARAARACA